MSVSTGVFGGGALSRVWLENRNASFSSQTRAQLMSILELLRFTIELEKLTLNKSFKNYVKLGLYRRPL